MECFNLLSNELNLWWFLSVKCWHIVLHCCCMSKWSHGVLCYWMNLTSMVYLMLGYIICALFLFFFTKSYIKYRLIVGVWYCRQVNFGMFMHLIQMFGLRGTGVILVQELRGALRPVRRVFYMPIGACSRGYKLRSREGACLRSLLAWWRAWSALCMCCYGASCRLPFLVRLLCVVVPCVYGTDLHFYSSRGANVQGLEW
jgi:hypothetical protein